MNARIIGRRLAASLCALTMAGSAAAQNQAGAVTAAPSPGPTTALAPKLDVETNVDQIAGLFIVNNTNAESSAVVGQVNSQGPDAAGVFGLAAGQGGFGGLFIGGLGASSQATALKAASLGKGPAFYATGSGVFDPNADSPVVATIEQQGYGTALMVSHTNNSSGDLAVFKRLPNPVEVATVARVDITGKGFFNGGTQTGGADVAEQIGVDGALAMYEPGDVLEISPDVDRHVRKSSEAYSTRVVGVYATRPGVLLSDLSINEDASSRVPLGVLGILPTKVSAENGAIRRGDLLVAASTPGHAMRAGTQAPAGSIIGKALATFDGPGVGVIELLVSVR